MSRYIPIERLKYPNNIPAAVLKVVVDASGGELRPDGTFLVKDGFAFMRAIARASDMIGDDDTFTRLTKQASHEHQEWKTSTLKECVTLHGYVPSFDIDTIGD